MYTCDNNQKSELKTAIFLSLKKLYCVTCAWSGSTKSLHKPNPSVENVPDP